MSSLREALAKMKGAPIRCVETDCRPVLREWRKSHGLAEDPLQAFRASGYTERASRERGVRKKGASSYA